MKYRVGDLYSFFMTPGRTVIERTAYEHQAVSPNDVCAVYSSSSQAENFLPSVSAKWLEDTIAPVFRPKEKGEFILCANKGKAGYLRLTSNISFTTTKDVFLLRSKRADEVDNQFFVLAAQDLFFSTATSKSDNGNFSKSTAENLSIWLPPIKMQLDIAKAWRKQEHIKAKLTSMLERVQGLIKTPASAEHEKVFLVKGLFRVTSGVRITQKEVYENDGGLPIITAKTENNGVAWHADREWLETFKKNGATVVVDRPCVTWTKNGNAGNLFVRDTSFYPGDDCGILLKLANIDREWFKFSAQGDVFGGVSSKGGQGKLFEAAMSNIPIRTPINPITNEIDLPEQRRIAAQYKRLQLIESRLQKLIAGCDSAMNRIRQLATRGSGRSTEVGRKRDTNTLADVSIS